MKDRIKEIRKSVKETQLAFADKLNVSKSTIEAIEYGRRDATDRIISDICRVYGVSESWLRTGEGDMFSPMDRSVEVAMITKKLLQAEENDFVYRLINVLANLNDDQVKVLKGIADQLLIDQNNDK